MPDRYRLLVTLSTFLLACSGGGGTTTTPGTAPVATVSITSLGTAVVAGQALQLTALVRDADGKILTGRGVSWTSSSLTVATVGPTGLVTGVAPGSVTITATSEGKAGTLVITVTTPAVASVTITAPGLSFTVGNGAQFTATTRDAQGNVLNGRQVAWSVSPSGVVTVSPAGLVTAVAPGAATLTATSEGISSSVALTVTAVSVASVSVTAPQTALAVGETSQYSAVTRDAQGNLLAGRPVTWASSLPAVATVSTTGLVTALTAGTTTITAFSEGIASPAIAVTITAGPALMEERILAQQGLAVALASTVLQSQLYVLAELALQGNDLSCVALPGGGALRLPAAINGVPAQVNYYFDTACTRIYMSETVSTFTDDHNGNFHIVASAAYTGPTGTPLGSIAFDEQANNIVLNGTAIAGTVNGLGTYTPLDGGPTVRLGLNCNLLAGGHNIGICQGGIAQNFPGLAKAFGSVTTLAVDSSAAGAVTFSGTSALMAGNLGALTLTQPTTTSMLVTGGTTYGATSDAGGAGNFSLFPPTPTGWTVTDATNDQKFTITVADNTVRNLVGTLTRLSSGATLATFALDQSGTGTITYSDHSVAAVVSWMLRQ